MGVEKKCTIKIKQGSGIRIESNKQAGYILKKKCPFFCDLRRSFIVGLQASGLLLGECYLNTGSLVGMLLRGVLQ
jgi:hypothetical protein